MQEAIHLAAAKDKLPMSVPCAIIKTAPDQAGVACLFGVSCPLCMGASFRLYRESSQEGCEATDTEPSWAHHADVPEHTNHPRVRKKVYLNRGLDRSC